MGLKDEVVKGIDNVRDGFSEAGHRATAEGEQTKRDVAGDAMTPGEHVESMFNQAKNSVQADVDATKQDARNSP